MARKMCNLGCGRGVGTGTGPGVDKDCSREMCNFCYTEGGWENTHSDYGHGVTPEEQAACVANGWDDQASIDSCWICHPEKNLAQRAARKGHTNTIAKTRRSHAGCSHPVTPKARAACRKAGGPA